MSCQRCCPIDCRLELHKSLTPVRLLENGGAILAATRQSIRHGESSSDGYSPSDVALGSAALQVPPAQLAQTAPQERQAQLEQREQTVPLERRVPQVPRVRLVQQVRRVRRVRLAQQEQLEQLEQTAPQERQAQLEQRERYPSIPGFTTCTSRPSPVARRPASQATAR